MCVKREQKDHLRDQMKFEIKIRSTNRMLGVVWNSKLLLNNCVVKLKVLGVSFVIFRFPNSGRDESAK